MWTRLYLGLLLLRLYFALSPSYIHPDENFQGPEVVAGTVFAYPHHSTWEFDPSKPIRSFFALFPVYTLPLHILNYLWNGLDSSAGPVPPRVAFYVLRTIMFLLSFVLEDWAVHELVASPQQRRTALILVASSYVTWAHQAHTFSNSVETVVVLWSLVLIKRILENKRRSHGIASFVLGFLFVYGTFNRITFPAWVAVPGLFLVPHCIRKPLTLMTIGVGAIVALLMALATDTAAYSPRPTFGTALQTLLNNPTITPLNSLLYNVDSENLAEHGLHSRFTHFLANLPQLLGPAIILLIPALLRSPQSLLNSPLILSAVSGTGILSVFPHQEARFLLPAVPLLLSSIHPPVAHVPRRIFLSTWIIFNVLLGILFGIHHQGGVMPMQMALGEHFRALRIANVPASALKKSWSLQGPGVEIAWWRTYSPPLWLLDAEADGPVTKDLMGRPAAEVRQLLAERTKKCGSEIWLVAPDASLELEAWQGWVGAWDGSDTQAVCSDIGKLEHSGGSDALNDIKWWKVHTERNHIGLDDMDFAEDGVFGTLSRVIGKRGLTAWRLKNCSC